MGLYTRGKGCSNINGNVSHSRMNMKKVLVVERTPSLCQKIVDVLHISSFETLSTPLETEGLALAQEHMPDLLIINYESQELSPEEIEEVLQSDMDTSDIPVLWIISESLYTFKMLDKNFKPESFLIAPFRPEELMLKINQHLPLNTSYRHMAVASSPVITNVNIPAHYYDSITGLPNQILLHQMLIEDIQTTPEEFLVGVLVMDLDRFRLINDALGHDNGDLLLKAISQRLINCVGSGDRVFHLGEDKFAVLLPDLIQEQDAAKVATDIIREVKQNIPFQNHELHITASIGISLYPTDTTEIKKLLRCSETAMYQAKEKGRNTFEFYSSFIRSKAYDRLNLETGLYRALKHEEFKLYYQPKVGLQTHKIIGMEALLRWHHEDYGWVSPNQFIPLAEETDLILTIGEWVLQEACAQNKVWHEMGYDNLCVTVNVSGQQFKTDMVKLVNNALHRTQLNPQFLQLELTESVLMKNVSNTVVKLGELKKKGVSIAVDDFGTGYSSLAYLKKFRLDTLKVDQSFVRDISNNKDDAAIVSAIINMAHSLGMDVVAEGVETRDQLNFLRAHNCDEIQGYYFSRPLPPEEFTELLKKDLTPMFEAAAETVETPSHPEVVEEAQSA